MTAKVKRAQVTEAAEAIRWTTHGDDAAAAEETRKRAKLCGPDAVALLRHVLTMVGYGSVPQRVRAATVLLEVGQFVASEAKPTGLFAGDTEDMTDANGRGAS